MKKYEFTNETKQVCDATLYRIRALRDFGDIEADDLGGFIEKEDNLSHEGNSWIYYSAHVFQNAMVYGNAHAKGYVVIEYANVSGRSVIHSIALYHLMMISII